MKCADEKPDNINDAENELARVISRRDMATQMSPEGSVSLSPRGRSSSPPSVPPLQQSENEHPAKLEIREVQVDKKATLISRPAKRGSCTSKKGWPGVQDAYQNATDAHVSSWDVPDASSDFPK